MKWATESVEDKLIHLKTHLWDFASEQDEKRNAAMAYALRDLEMVASNALSQYRSEQALKEQ